MSDEPRSPEADVPPANGRLQSWKEIAAYLDRDVRTVQRWERQFGLPVYRNPDQKRSAVYALRHELDAWLVSTHVARGEVDAPPARVAQRWAAVATGLFVVGVLLVWLIRFAGSPPTSRPMAEQLAAFRFTSGLASPDGRWYAYRDAERTFLRVKALVAEQPDRLLVDEPVLDGFVWSPDSRQVAYMLPVGNPRRLEIVGLESAERRVVQDGSPIAPPNLIGWSATGTEVFGRAFGGRDNPQRIVAVDVATGHVRDLGALVDGTPAALSPNGRLLAFLGWSDGRQAPDLYVHDLDTGHSSRLTDDPLADHSPAWSSDSRVVAFARGYNTDADRRLLAVPVGPDGAPVGPVADLGPAGDFHPAASLSVSVNGDIFVGRRFEGSRAAVQDLDPETAQPIGSPRLDFPEGSDISWWIDDRTVWIEDFTLSAESPGQRLYIERDLVTGEERIVEGPGNAPADAFRESSRPGLSWRYQRAPNGRAILRRRADRSDAEPFLDVDAPIQALTVSPDESALALVTYHAARRLYEVSAVDVASRRLTPLAQTRLDFKPLWSPDSREISIVDGPCLLVAARDGSGVDEVTCAPMPRRLPSGRPVPVAFIDQLLWLDLNLASWSPDGSRLLFAVPVSTEDRVELWAVDRRTGAHDTLYAGERGYTLIPRGPAWSPSGVRVSFSLRRQPPTEVWVMRRAVSRLPQPAP